MLLNFCEPVLRTEVKSSTVSTEGHEATNLVSHNDKGFLAYSCIKPPVHVDFTFLCNIQVRHVKIWVLVGGQKSTGFQLLTKSRDDGYTPFTRVSTCYLTSDQTSVVFSRRDGADNDGPSSVSISGTDVARSDIRITDKRAVDYVSQLRISILKTSNSVPGLGRVEIWGSVSPRCGKDVVAGIFDLWSRRQTPKCDLENVSGDDDLERNRSDTKLEPVQITRSGLEIPEDFLDPITWEIMTQPLTLPSGKVVDQSTLTRHEETEAIWGRGPSDPFTGIRFTKTRRPVVAVALKSQIDRFLLENSDFEEVKKLPRVVGRKIRSFPLDRAKATPGTPKEEPECTKASTSSRSSMESVSRKRKDENHRHALPVSVVSSKMSYDRPVKVRKMTDRTKLESDEKATVDPIVFDSALPGLRNFSKEIPAREPSLVECSCCEDAIYYKLPCKHILCRKVLTSIDNSECRVCKVPFKSTDPERIHLT